MVTAIPWSFLSSESFQRFSLIRYATPLGNLTSPGESFPLVLLLIFLFPYHRYLRFLAVLIIPLASFS